jgi:hypothetical protein
MKAPATWILVKANTIHGSLSQGLSDKFNAASDLVELPDVALMSDKRLCTTHRKKRLRQTT